METNHVTSLRSLAEQRGIFIGTAANALALHTEAAYREILAQEYNLLTPENEMKFGPLSSHPGVYDFCPAEELVRFAQANDMHVRGHTLVWHAMNPTWLIEENYNRSQAMELLYKHIFTVMGHFHGEVFAWDVINEPILADGSLRDSFWSHTIGQDYIELALRWAHEADPNAQLFINEYGAEGINRKSDALYGLVKDLLARGVPLHGVGLQAHWALTSTQQFVHPPAASELLDNMKRLSDLGLDIHITEMDLQIHGIPGNPEESLQKQAEVYETILQTALQIPQFKAFITWGFSDRHCWIPQFAHHQDSPLPFDAYYHPKPAYEALYRVLES